MKKIINGKVYNTETATFLGDYQYSYLGDFNYYYEKFYQTKKGTYFLSGEGGPSSKYAEPCSSGGWNEGVGIIVLSESEARAWAERCLSPNEYCEIFDEIEEG